MNHVVEAFQRLPEKRLIVTSGGPNEPRIRRLATEYDNIEVTGPVSETRLNRLMGTCIATVYIPRDEDFGMAPLESMAAGKPVIGVAEGGLLETVADGATGILIKPNPTTEDLMDAVLKMTPERALGMREACEERARLFRTEVFVEKMKEIV
jgi:glycosyltransferase involved in cell wall biosynthesis